MQLTHQDILNLTQRYRGTFINSLSGIRQAVLVGTKSPSGKSNLAIFNSLIHIGANPPYYGLLFRPDTVRRDTLTNILETGQYSFNYVSGDDYQKAHQTSAKYETEKSEFDAVGFTEDYRENFYAPFVKEAVITIGMKFEERIDIRLNGTILIMGSIQHVYLDDSLVSEDGLIDLASGNILACSGLYQYFNVTEVGRLPYARP
jgi:flavin reductase (DIM6/NTAB) family NADH-FMN oxidoreductase RutF